MAQNSNITQSAIHDNKGNNKSSLHLWYIVKYLLLARAVTLWMFNNLMLSLLLGILLGVEGDKGKRWGLQNASNFYIYNKSFKPMVCFSHGIKGYIPTIIGIISASEKNWFLVRENECGMFCVRKITRWKAVGITKRLIHKC